MLAVECPECSVKGSIFLCQPVYEGPYRCWKCRSLFTVEIENNESGSAPPLAKRNLRSGSKRIIFQSIKAEEV